MEATLWHLSPVKLQRDTLITSKPPWEVQELHGVLGEFPEDFPEEKYTVWSFSARNRKFEKLPLERRHVTSETSQGARASSSWGADPAGSVSQAYGHEGFSFVADAWHHAALANPLLQYWSPLAMAPDPMLAPAEAQPKCVPAPEEFVKLTIEIENKLCQPMPRCKKFWEGQDGFECRLARFRCQHGDKHEFFYLRCNQGREEAAVFNDLSFQDALDTFPDEVRLVARETTRDSGKPSSTSAHSPAQPLSSREELVKLVIELKDGFCQPMDACSKSWHGEDGFERRLGECCELHGPGKFFYIGKGGKEAVFNECSFKDALDAFKDKDEVTLLMRKAEMSDSRQYSSTSVEKAGPQDSCQASAAEARMVAWKVGVKNTFINCDEWAGDPADSDPQHGTAPAVLQQIIMPNDGSYIGVPASSPAS